MKRGFASISLTLVLLALPAAGMTGVSYTQPGSVIGVGGGDTSSGNYSGLNTIGDPAAGKTIGIDYIDLAGGIAILAQTAMPGSPVISNFRIEGRRIVDNDYIKAAGTLTASVTDETAVDINLSSVEVDGAYTAFSALTGTSTYDAATGSLTFAFSGLPDGSHILGIRAIDNYGNVNHVRRVVQVDAGTLKAAGVFIYPNPFNPRVGTARIAYRLTNDGVTSVYIFNAVGQLVYKQSYASGAEGGRVGYNEVDWSGAANSGAIVANDIYFLRVVSDGRVIGKCKIAVIK